MNTVTLRTGCLVLVSLVCGWPFCGLTISCGRLLADETVPAGFVEAAWIAPPSGARDDGPLPLFRREFTLQAVPNQATLRIVGLGDYDVRCNGHRLAATGINQAWSQYEKTLYYRDYDITTLVQRSANCVGVLMTNSFWDNHKPPGNRYYKEGPQRTATEPLLLRAEVLIEHADGAVQRIGTDSTWRTHTGPVLFSHIFAGEDYDARRVMPGWDRQGFDDSGWRAARIATAPPAELRPQTWPPIEVAARFAPVSERAT